MQHTVQRQHTFTWTTHNRRAQKNRKRTQNCTCSSTKQFRADSWTHIGNWVHDTSNGEEVSPRKDSVRRQFNIIRRHALNLHDRYAQALSRATVPHQQFNISTQQQQACYSIKSCEIKTHDLTEKRDRQWSTAATQLSSCANRTNSRHNETDTAIRVNDKKKKILPHAIDTQILEFTVLHKMCEPKGWLNKGEPNLRTKVPCGEIKLDVTSHTGCDNTADS